MDLSPDLPHGSESLLTAAPGAVIHRFLAWLVAPGLERLALANQWRHKLTPHSDKPLDRPS